MSRSKMKVQYISVFKDQITEWKGPVYEILRSLFRSSYVSTITTSRSFCTGLPRTRDESNMYSNLTFRKMISIREEIYCVIINLFPIQANMLSHEQTIDLF